jgi:hypothetical protein
MERLPKCVLSVFMILCNLGNHPEYGRRAALKQFLKCQFVASLRRQDEVFVLLRPAPVCHYSMFQANSWMTFISRSALDEI